jgi:hypothetical protein
MQLTQRNVTSKSISRTRTSKSIKEINQERIKNQNVTNLWLFIHSCMDMGVGSQCSNIKKNTGDRKEFPDKRETLYILDKYINENSSN